MTALNPIAGGCGSSGTDSHKGHLVTESAAPSQVGYIDDRFGPLGLAAVVVLALTAILIISIVDFAEQLKRKEPHNASPAGPPLAAPATWLPTQRSSLRGLPFQDPLQRA